MDLYAVVDQVLDLLRTRKRVTYSAIQRQFELDDVILEELKTEILFAHPQAQDQGGIGLFWSEEEVLIQDSAPASSPLSEPLPSPGTPSVQSASLSFEGQTREAERRQLTVMFCDLVGSTNLSGQLDPEDFREVVRAYHESAAEVIQTYDGYIAQYFGDGLLVYFGFPQAHEDDARRAVYTGLGIVHAVRTLNTRLEARYGVQLAVRLGIHTGPVVVGEMGGGGRHEQLALGETPNIAARLQGYAEPGMVVISESTDRLVQGYFACQALGTPTLRGVSHPLALYRVQSASGVQSRLDFVPTGSLTPLVGREQEVGLLLERWTQMQEGIGQVIMLSGEAGIGKSRLIQVLKAHVAGAPHTLWEFRCSPYFQHTALYPVIDWFHRLLHWQPDETMNERLRKLETALAPSHLSLDETVPLLAELLALPLPTTGYAPLTLPPDQQRRKTLETLLALVLAQAVQQPVLLIMEDLHWVDPSTLELLTLLIDQAQTAPIFMVVTCRPEFQPPWGVRTHLTPLALDRLPRVQIEAMVARMTEGKRLPEEVLEQIVAKTDGVPLFVEELTKTVLELELLHDADGHYELRGPLPALAIPTTLYDSLMARLDRLASVKAVAQLSSTLGRQFSHSIGFSGGQLPSYGEDSSALDSPLIHEALSQDKL